MPGDEKDIFSEIERRGARFLYVAEMFARYHQYRADTFGFWHKLFQVVMMFMEQARYLGLSEMETIVNLV